MGGERKRECQFVKDLFDLVRTWDCLTRELGSKESPIHLRHAGLGSPYCLTEYQKNWGPFGEDFVF